MIDEFAEAAEEVSEESTEEVVAEAAEEVSEESTEEVVAEAAEEVKQKKKLKLKKLKNQLKKK